MSPVPCIAFGQERQMQLPCSKCGRTEGWTASGSCSLCILAASIVTLTSRSEHLTIPRSGPRLRIRPRACQQMARHRLGNHRAVKYINGFMLLRRTTLVPWGHTHPCPRAPCLVPLAAVVEPVTAGRHSPKLVPRASNVDKVGVGARAAARRLPLCWRGLSPGNRHAHRDSKPPPARSISPVRHSSHT